MPNDPPALSVPSPESSLASSDDSRFWLETTEFAELACVERQTAWKALKRCHTGGTWHKTALRVRMVASAGGKSGQAYQVIALSLPSELATIWATKHPELFKKTEAPRVVQHVPESTKISASDPRRLGAISKGVFLEAMIKPALVHIKYSKDRPEAIRGILATMPVTLPNGTTKTYDQRGISFLIAKYEKGGLSALIRAPRQEPKPSRVFVSREFDKTAPFTDSEKEEIWAELRQHIKDLYLTTHGTTPSIERLANVRLVELAKARGWAGASLENCRVGIAQTRKFNYLRKVAAKGLDAKKFADHFKPRVMRHRRGLGPMEIVMGDVHPVDVLNLRDDESEATARMVAWLDLATNRVFYNLFLFAKGKAITQAHIAWSFVQMVRAWGLPSLLYLDNGSEYVWKEMMDGFMRLSTMVEGFRAYCMTSEEVEQRIDQAENEDDSPEESHRAVVRSLPHNPPGKAPIEGLFGVLERTVLCFIPGWIGGDRMNKKTHKMGKKPAAFKGSFEEFERAFATAAEFYHAKAQRDGSSPNGKFDQHVRAGWQAVDVDYSVLLMALAERKLYKVENTGIEIEGKVYWHDIMATAHVMGGQVVVYKAKWDMEQIIVLPRDPETKKFADPVVAYQTRDFGIVDKAGAIEAGRRQGIQNKNFREEKRGSSRVDAVAEMGKYVALSPPATVVPFGPKITLPPEFKGLREAVEQAGEPPKVEHVRLLEGQWIDRETGKVRSMYDRPCEREADTVSTWEDEERERLIQKGRAAIALNDSEENDLPGDRLTGQL